MQWYRPIQFVIFDPTLITAILTWGSRTARQRGRWKCQSGRGSRWRCSSQRGDHWSHTGNTVQSHGQTADGAQGGLRRDRTDRWRGGNRDAVGDGGCWSSWRGWGNWRWSHRYRGEGWVQAGISIHIWVLRCSWRKITVSKRDNLIQINKRFTNSHLLNKSTNNIKNKSTELHFKWHSFQGKINDIVHRWIMKNKPKEI